jgi:hypothetical protein
MTAVTNRPAGALSELRKAAYGLLVHAVTKSCLSDVGVL